MLDLSALAERRTGDDWISRRVAGNVIEGEGELETSDGEKIQVTAGGIYSFPNGFTATWRTRSPLLKFFVMA